MELSLLCLAIYQETKYQIRGRHVHYVEVGTGPKHPCLIKRHDNHYITNKTHHVQKGCSCCAEDIEHVGTLGIVDSVRVVHFLVTRHDCKNLRREERNEDDASRYFCKRFSYFLLECQHWSGKLTLFASQKLANRGQ